MKTLIDLIAGFCIAAVGVVLTLGTFVGMLWLLGKIH